MARATDNPPVPATAPSFSATRRMKIVLISPKGPLYRHRGGIWKKSLRYQPLTLTTLAALAPPELDIEFRLFDEGTGNLPLDLDADLVGMTVITGSSLRAYELSAHYRRRGIKVVLGGPHVTLMPDEAAQHADAICTGYADRAWPELLRDFSRGAMRPRYVQAPDLDLAGLPFARRELFDKRDYLTQAVFEATRSCAHDCEFCAASKIYGPMYRVKPVKQVVDEIKEIKKSWANPFIEFADDNTFVRKGWSRELLDELKPLGLQWFTETDISIADDDDALQALYESGCRQVLIGLESVKASVLDGIDARNWKLKQLGHYKAAIDKIQSYGVTVNGTFIVGNDGDTPDTFRAR